MPRHDPVPHGFDGNPDGACHICRYPVDAPIHDVALSVVPDRATPAVTGKPKTKPPTWGEMTASQRWVVLVVGIGASAVFLSVCAALSTWLLRLAGLL